MTEINVFSTAPSVIERRRKMIELAGRKCGFSYSDLPFPITTLQKDTIVLMANGVLFRRSPTFSKKGMRYFTSSEAAEAFFGPVKSSVLRDRRLKTSAPSGGPARIPGEPVFTASTVYTIAPLPIRSLRTNTHPRG